ncbi:MAG: DUF1932 domain-containing protein [Congregibacter sp.]
MNTECVGIVGLGEVGRVLTEDLLAHSMADIRVWDHQFDNSDSRAAKNLRELAASPRLSVAGCAEQAAGGCQLILCAVTADQALKAAQAVLPSLQRGTVFIDLNSISPGAKQAVGDLIESADGRFVEAAVMSPINPLRSGSPILLSGPNAMGMVSMLESLGFHAVSVVSEAPGVASATKMCRSVIVKGMEALVSESLLAARHYGVEESVLGSLSNLFPGPDWPQHARYLISRTLLHGERRAAEMREVANTVSEAGCEPWMSAATVERQAWAAQFEPALSEDSLEEMLDAIRAASVLK